MGGHFARAQVSVLTVYFRPSNTGCTGRPRESEAAAGEPEPLGRHELREQMTITITTEVIDQEPRRGPLAAERQGGGPPEHQRRIWA